jgi:SAM-dependent methyltransferase
MQNKPFSPACERNRDPILNVLREHFANRSRVLEIGSGNGQHAVHFAAAMPHLCWQTSDRPEYLVGIRQWLDEVGLSNTPPPLTLDVAIGPWPTPDFDAVFSANTLHIMPWTQVQLAFAGLTGVLAPSATLVIYGPFNYAGQFTSASNANFDRALKADAPSRGIRDFEAVDALARAQGWRLHSDLSMPANNRCLIWTRDVARENEKADANIGLSR